MAALAALGLALWRYELLVAVAFFALGGVRFDPAPVDAVIAVLVAVALVTGRIDLRRVPAPALVLVGVLLAVNLVSGVAVDDIPLAAQYFSITLYLAVFAVWLCSYLAAQRRVRLVVGAYVAGAAVSALLGTLALVAAIPGLPADLFVAYGTRATGLFQDPNVFGPFLVPAALIMLEETLIPRLLRLGRPLSAVLFAVLTIGVLLSYSRAAWLNLVVGVFVMVVFYALRGGGRTLSRMLVALAIAASVLATALAMTGGFAFLEERAQLQAYDAERFGGQDQALATAEAHPLGVGPGQLELTQTQLPAQRLRARAGRAGRRRPGRPARAVRRHPLDGARRRSAPRACARSRHRRGAGGVVRAADQQPGDRHAALASPLVRRRAGLGCVARPPTGPGAADRPDPLRDPPGGIAGRQLRADPARPGGRQRRPAGFGASCSPGACPRPAAAPWPS